MNDFILYDDEGLIMRGTIEQCSGALLQWLNGDNDMFKFAYTDVNTLYHDDEIGQSMIDVRQGVKSDSERIDTLGFTITGVDFAPAHVQDEL